MILTPAQAKWIEKRRDVLNEIIDAKPREGLISYHIELTALVTIIELHNIEMRDIRAKRDAKAPTHGGGKA